MKDSRGLQPSGQQVVFTLRAIELLDFTMAQPGENPAEPGTGVQFSINAEQSVNIGASTVRVVVTVTGHALHAGKTIQMCNMRAGFTFAVENLANIATTEHGVPHFPAEMNELFLSTAIATTRGMLFVKTQGTIIENAIVPMIDVKTLLPADPKN